MLLRGDWRREVIVQPPPGDATAKPQALFSLNHAVRLVTSTLGCVPTARLTFFPILFSLIICYFYYSSFILFYFIFFLWCV